MFMNKSYIKKVSVTLNFDVLGFFVMILNVIFFYMKVWSAYELLHVSIQGRNNMSYTIFALFNLINYRSCSSSPGTASV